MSRPETITLSAAAGEAIIARLSVYAPSRSDCEILIQVLRWYFWLAAAIQEAKLSLKKLRTLLLSQGPQPPTLCEPEVSSVSTSSRGDDEVSGDGWHGMRRAGGPQKLGPSQSLSHRRWRQASPEAAIGRAPAASEPRPIRGPSGWSAAMRSWRWGSAARCVVRAPSMRCLLGWRCASTAMPCSAPYATR